MPEVWEAISSSSVGSSSTGAALPRCERNGSLLCETSVKGTGVSSDRAAALEADFAEAAPFRVLRL